MILACDVGGAKTDIALLETGVDGVEVLRRATHASREHGALHEIVADFVGARPPALTAAGIGVAGPVVGTRARTTNLPWHVDAERLARTVGLPRVALLDDVVAQAWAVPLLRASDLVTLQGAGPVALASEGGHADFSPTDEMETGLLRSLTHVHGRVSVERVVSGPGRVRRRGRQLVAAHVRLYARFASRGQATYAHKVLSAMRAGFGGHQERS